MEDLAPKDGTFTLNIFRETGYRLPRLAGSCTRSLNAPNARIDRAMETILAKKELAVPLGISCSPTIRPYILSPIRFRSPCKCESTARKFEQEKGSF